MEKKKVAFICVHNSCRSQIAEALGKHLAGDVFESYSMGCNVGCPFIGRTFDDNWGLEDPTGKSGYYPFFQSPLFSMAFTFLYTVSLI